MLSEFSQPLYHAFEDFTQCISIGLGLFGHLVYL